MLLTLFLFISKSAYNIPLALMAMLGLCCLAKSRDLLASPAIKYFCGLFLCLWIPQVLSLVDAVNFKESLRICLSYLRFLFAGVLLLYYSRKWPFYDLIQKGAFIIVSVWCIDATFQYFIGFNIFGYPLQYGLHPVGMFYPRNTISHLCAVLAPIYFDYVLHLSKRKTILLLPLIYTMCFIILINSRRAAWIMFFIASLSYLSVLLFAYKDHINKKQIILFTFSAIVLVTITYVSLNTNSELMNRVHNLKGMVFIYKLFAYTPENTGGYNFIIPQDKDGYMITSNSSMSNLDKAVNRRIKPWILSAKIFQYNWINGIGPRGYRYVNKKVNNYNHPHMTILEIACETGVIGLIGYLLFILGFSYWFIKSRHKIKLIPLSIAVIVATLPFNSHMAFYGSYWSSFIWWLIILAFIRWNEVNQPLPNTPSLTNTKF